VIALTAIAATTRTLRLGTGVLVLTERDPIILAKQLAGLDHVSGGRLLVGVGPGWNVEAMENHGVDPRHRTAIFRERAKAMIALWTQEAAEFHGRYVHFDPVWMWPKPVQKPHPPLLVGGFGPSILERVLELGGGWLASGLHHETELLRRRTAELARLAADRGRERVPVTLQLAKPEPAALEAYAEMGLARCTFRLEPEEPRGVIAQIASLSRLLRPYGL
jgi:probable F420-dependent oxidoreductase